MTEIKFWGEGWTPQGVVEIPIDYGRMEAGSAFATRTAKKMTAEFGRPVFIEMKNAKRGGCSRAVAYWVPRAILPEVRQAEAESESRREAAREKAGLTRATRHERELARLAARLGLLYPAMPENERTDVVERAFEVGSDRVGRTTKLDEDRKLELAVIAHVRHTHTEYDERLASGEDREYIRQDIHRDVVCVIERWQMG